MATEPLPASIGRVTAGSIPLIELRSRLNKLLRAPTSPARITVIGLDQHKSTVLHQTPDRPEDILLGFDLAPDYQALAVVASSVVSMTPGPAHRDASLALGINRDGEVASMLKTDDRVIATSNPQGWLIDSCRRAVSLATADCAVASLCLPISRWLDRLMVALVDDAGPVLSWPDAVDLSPTPHQWRSLDPVELGITLGSAAPSWRTLRLAAAHGVPAPVDIEPAHAAWMDDPMFARWCMGAFPDLNNLRCDVDFLAPPEVAEGIERALRAAWLAFDGSATLPPYL